MRNLRRTALLLICMLLAGLTTTASAARPTILGGTSGTVYAAAGETVTLYVETDSYGKTFIWEAVNDYTLPENESRYTNTYTFTMTPELDGALINCYVAFDRWSYRYSDGVWLELPLITFTEHPEDVEVIIGDTATAHAAATGDGLTYQWYWDGPDDDDYVPVPCTGPDLSVVTTKAGKYLIRCTATDKSGQTQNSYAAHLTVYAPVYIITDIKSVALQIEESETLFFMVEGLDVTYQWYEQNAGSSKFTPCDQTEFYYELTMDKSADGRQIYCVATDRSGNTVTSAVATLTLDTSVDGRGNCDKCSGDGHCNRCAGTGKYYKNVIVGASIERVQVECDSTYCDYGHCTNCGGDGWVGEKTVAGDADGNGTVNTRDALLTMQYAAGWDVEIVDYSADANGNKVIEPYDAVLILQNIAGD